MFLSRQKNSCRDRHTFFATNTCLSGQNTTKVCLSRQNFCRRKHVLSRQKTFCVCPDKTFVATKMILMAAPASDKRCPLSRTVWIGEQNSWFLYPAAVWVIRGQQTCNTNNYWSICKAQNLVRSDYSKRLYAHTLASARPPPPPPPTHTHTQQQQQQQQTNVQNVERCDSKGKSERRSEMPQTHG